MLAPRRSRSGRRLRWLSRPGGAPGLLTTLAASPGPQPVGADERHWATPHTCAGTAGQSTPRSHDHARLRVVPPEGTCEMGSHNRRQRRDLLALQKDHPPW